MTKDLIEKYEKLPAFEKSIMQILSIAYISLTRTQLKMCLIAADIKVPGAENFDAVSQPAGFKLIRPALDNLIKQKLLDNKNKSRLIADRRVFEIILRKTIAEKKTKHYLELIPAALNLTEKGLAQSTRVVVDYVIAVIRILFYQKKIDSIQALYNQYQKIFMYERISLSTILERIAFHPFEPDLVELLPPDIITDLFKHKLIYDILNWRDEIRHFEYLENLVSGDSDKCEPDLQSLVLEKWMLTGQNKKVENWLKKHKNDNSINSLCLQGWIAFLNSKNKTAIKYYDAAFKILEKNSKKRNIYFSTFMGVFYILSLMKDNSAKRLQQARSYLFTADSANYAFKVIYNRLNYFLNLLTGNTKIADSVFDLYCLSNMSYNMNSRTYNIKMEMFFTLSVCCWIDKERTKKYFNGIKKIYLTGEADSYSWFKHELAGLLNALSAKGAKKKYKPETDYLINVVNQTNIWEHTLNALLDLKNPTSAQSKEKSGNINSDFRLVWFISYSDGGYCSVSPREQKQKADGTWTKGRPIAMKRLYKDLKKFPYLTQQDKQICDQIYEHEYVDNWYTNVEYIFKDKYISYVIGHPLIFLQDGTSRVELIKGKPELRITKQKNGDICLELFPRPSQYQEDYLTVKETETR
ncbi:MAG: hypothetical protein U9N77_03220, partial [Thermodesulfobacteriota bacterium]|nr:hypothetical protein [Thermodesulfobacteriota bacterium]